MATLTLAEFCTRAAGLAAGTPPDEVAARIADCLPGLLANDTLLSPCHRTAPAEGYGRNLLFACPDGRFSILAMVWPPGVATPIHDHRTWCAFGVYEGAVEEVRYDRATDAPGCRRAVRRASALHATGAAGSLPCCSEIHSLGNPGGCGAVSIHVYGGDARLTGPNLERIYAL